MYELTELLIYRPVFMLELLTAEFMFSKNLRRRKHFFWRAAGAVAVCFGASFAVPIVANNTLYGSFLFVLLFAVSVGGLVFMYDESFKNIAFCAIAGFTVQHGAHELYEFFNAFAGAADGGGLNFYGDGSIFAAGVSSPFFSGGKWFFLVVYLQIYIIVYLLCYGLFGSKIKKYEILQLNNLTILVIAVLIVFIDVVFGAIIIWSLPASVDTVSVSMLHMYNILCCALALVMLFELPRRKGAENELAVVRQLRHRETEQYRISKENVELINLKCHDLKHQIRRFRNSETVSGSELEELEKLMDIYDSSYRTANEALNVILMEKSLICKRASVNLSCIIDAEKLDFMRDADVYALFGNLLDNAIEAVRRLPEDERSVGLSVKRVKNFLAVNVYNGYAGEVRLENGLPVTTKAEKAFHGFGMKSIRHTVEKYNGTLRISAGNHIFDVKILFPLVSSDPAETEQFTD